MKVLQIFYSFQWGIWSFNASIVVPFIIKMMIFFINIKYQMFGYFLLHNLIHLIRWWRYYVGIMM